MSGATFYDCINTIYQFIKPFLDNKISIFEEYGMISSNSVSQQESPDQTMGHFLLTEVIKR